LIFPEADLRKLVELQEGDVFKADKIRKSLDAFRQLYASEGYIDFTPMPGFGVDNANQRVSLILVFDQEKQFRIGTVEVLGLNPSTEAALRSIMKTGEVFTMMRLNNSSRRTSRPCLEMRRRRM
jgi:outer membrane protein assembly factor BamA